MKRFVELDVLRGGLLLMMIVDHSPSWLRRFTDQPLGFFTTAECFVFVSAFLAGMLFRKRTEKLGFGARSATIRRAGRIYCAHVATIAFTFVLGSFCLFEFPGIANLLDRYLINPLAAISGALALLFRPPLMDILPMYKPEFCQVRCAFKVLENAAATCRDHLPCRPICIEIPVKNCARESWISPASSFRSARTADCLALVANRVR
jgi:hypothetical protein